MRIWSLHPQYLDAKGLVALWRETLLAKNVLEGKTKGYKNHPQLNRFKKTKNPVAAINQYLLEVLQEAKKRGYNFNAYKINKPSKNQKLNVTSGQMKYEQNHLLNKLKKRDKNKFNEVNAVRKFKPHPIFKITKGEIEDWEVI